MIQAPCKTDWTQSHCGLMQCTISESRLLMPEINPMLTSIIPHLQFSPANYIVDCKVHMLMPGEYPCIPNWHCDFIPRDEDLTVHRDKIRDNQHMYLWTSGAPYTEFKSHQGVIETDEGFNWIAFNQRDIHRGTKSEAHQWRCFIRLIPAWFQHPCTLNVGTVRRHSQVYIDDVKNFAW